MPCVVSVKVGSWDQSLTLYNLGSGASGAKEGKRIPLTFDPLSIKYVHDGEFLLVAGTGDNTTRTDRGGNHEIHQACVLSLDLVSAMCCATVEGSVVLFSKDGQKLTTLLHTQGTPLPS